MTETTEPTLLAAHRSTSQPAQPVALPEPTADRPQPGQLTFTAPRRGKPPRHLADLSPEERKEAVAALGHPGFRAKQLSTHYFERLVDDPEEMTDLPKAVRADLVTDLLPTLLDADRPAGRRRRADDEVRVAPARRRDRRVGAHALPQAGHDLHLEPGRLRDELPLLRHGPGRAHPQHVRGRDRRAGRLGRPCAAPRRAGRRRRRRRPRVAAAGQQRRLHGDGGGRWPTTRPRSARSAGSPTPPPTASASRRAASPCRRSGSCPGMDKLTAEGIPVTLALSLHAPDDELRNELVPINTRWSVDEALDAAHRYFEATGRRVSIEYALIRDINDQGWRADLLGEKLRARGAGWVHVNPIPLNPTPGLEVDGVAARRRAELRRAAAQPRHPDDDPRHAWPGHRRSLRAARRLDGLTPTTRPGRCQIRHLTGLTLVCGRVRRHSEGMSNGASTTAYARAHELSLRDPDAFWGAAAAGIDWITPPERVLDDDRPPFYRWFTGGELNVCANAVDRHVEAGRGSRPRSTTTHPSPARSRPSRMPLCSLACAPWPAACAGSGSRRATGSSSTCRWCPRPSSRCSPARGSAPSTPSSSAGSRRRSSRHASTTPRPR